MYLTLLRVRKGYTRARLARDARVSERTLIRLERGATVRPETLARIAITLGVDVDAFTHDIISGQAQTEMCSGGHGTRRASLNSPAPREEGAA